MNKNLLTLSYTKFKGTDTYKLYKRTNVIKKKVLFLNYIQVQKIDIAKEQIVIKHS